MVFRKSKKDSLISMHLVSPQDLFEIFLTFFWEFQFFSCFFRIIPTNLICTILINFENVCPSDCRFYEAFWYSCELLHPKMEFTAIYQSNHSFQGIFVFGLHSTWNHSFFCNFYSRMLWIRTNEWQFFPYGHKKKPLENSKDW